MPKRFHSSRWFVVFCLAAAAFALACSSAEEGRAQSPSASSTPTESAARAASGGTREAGAAPAGRAVAVFAGGCFWCMEGPFEALDGVDEVLSGYTGGPERAPTYRQVSAHRTGHVEAVRVVYDPTRVSYRALLEVFFHNIDPTQDDGQFCDRGEQYRSAVFVANAEERAAAERAVARAGETLGRSIVTTVRPAGPFWIAEDYHQDFYRTHPAHYRRYREGCGRDRRLRALWGEAAAH